MAFDLLSVVWSTRNLGRIPINTNCREPGFFWAACFPLCNGIRSVFDHLRVTKLLSHPSVNGNCRKPGFFLVACCRLCDGILSSFHYSEYVKALPHLPIMECPSLQRVLRCQWATRDPGIAVPLRARGARCQWATRDPGIAVPPRAQGRGARQPKPGRTAKG